jgi:glycosyltransferase involved in cell wall biosynthesis
MNNKSEVLFISYNFPPRGGAAVQRTIKFLKYLPKFGWRPDVLTLLTDQHLFPDSSLAKQLPNEMRTYYVKELQIPLKKILPKKLNQLLQPNIPDKQCLWIVPAAQKALKLIKQNKTPLIYTTGPPHSVHLVGYLCKFFSDVNWVADFRDTWSGNPFFCPPNGVKKIIHKKFESMVIGKANFIIANTKNALQHFNDNYPGQKEKFACIPNGFDPEDFEKYNFSKPNNEFLTLMSVGSVGASRPMNFFFDAIKRFIEKNPETRNTLRVVFVGNLSVQTQNFAKKFGISDIVSFTNHLAHSEAIKLMKNADVLLLFQFKGHGGETAVPSKIYEYMKAKKNIWAQACDGPTKDLTLNYKGGYFADAQNVSQIEKVLSKLYDSFKEGRLKEIEDSSIEQYNREYLTAQLSNIFNKAKNS